MLFVQDAVAALEREWQTVDQLLGADLAKELIHAPTPEAWELASQLVGEQMAQDAICSLLSAQDALTDAYEQEAQYEEAVRALRYARMDNAWE